MKKVIIIVVLSFLAVSAAIYSDFSTKGTNTTKETRIYDSGYENGYDDGYSEGYREAKEHFPEIIHDAEHYAAITGGWHPEEAWGIVESYLTRTPMDDDGVPNYEDYLAAVDSLICFYEYFYGRHY